MQYCETGGPSQYNEGKGINIKLDFYPLDKSKKRRSNAKPACTSSKLSMHEDFPLLDFLTHLMEEINRFELLQDSRLVRLSRLQLDSPDLPNSFEVQYSIFGTSDKNISISSVAAYQTMVEDVIKRRQPQLVVKLTELFVEVCTHSELLERKHIAYTLLILTCSPIPTISNTRKPMPLRLHTKIRTMMLMTLNSRP